ncbi:MAG: LysR family transcriptional regulator [Myxococcota bacterium]
MDASEMDLRAFVRVAHLGSFAAAARELRLSTTAVSRRVARLEEDFGGRLLNRTTRQVSLTSTGGVVLARAERILSDLQELRDLVAGDDNPRGHIRATAGVSLGQAVLQEGLPRFLEAHPDVSLEVVLSDRTMDLVAERIDVAIRIGKLADSGLFARKLATVGHTVCAAPAWLEAQGGLPPPDRIQTLARVVDTNQPSVWRLSGPNDETLEVEATGRYSVNSAHAARDACQAGLGLALLPDFVARPLLQERELVDAMTGWKGPELGLYAVTIERRWVSAAVRSLVAHIRELVDVTA